VHAAVLWWDAVCRGALLQARGGSRVFQNYAAPTTRAQSFLAAAKIEATFWNCLFRKLPKEY
jgi:hypothetical protein